MRTKPLRIEAAPLLTQSRLQSTMRSIFKHNTHCSISPLCAASSRNHMAWIKTPLKSTARAARTNKHANTRGSVASACEIHTDARCSSRARRHWSKRPLLETIGLKSCCSRARGLPLALTNLSLFFFPTPLIPFLFLKSLSPLSLLSPVLHNLPPTPTVRSLRLPKRGLLNSAYIPFYLPQLFRTLLHAVSGLF